MSSSSGCDLARGSRTKWTKPAALVGFAALLVLTATGSRCGYPLYVRGHWAGFAMDVKVAGHLAYVGGEAIYVLDVSDPGQPVEIGHLAAQGDVLKVALDGSRLYVLDRIGISGGPTALRIVDVSDPTDPRELGSLEVPEVGRKVGVLGNLAYVVVPGGLRVIDVSDPAAPFEVGNFLGYRGVSGGDVVLPYGYGVSASALALVIVDLVQMTEVGNLPGFGPSDVVVSEGFAFGAAGWDGFALAIADVSDPTAPFDTGARAVPGTGHDVELDTHFAYLAVTNSFAVADVLDPLAPFEIGRISAAGAREVALEGHLAFVAAGDRGLYILGFDPEATACSDGLDNDGDGQTDADDPHCEGPNDASEHPDCQDGFDNDGDGLADHPGDPDCLSPDDLSEIPDCRDGLDNDGDGLVDLVDPSCVDVDDPAEEPECRDGFDNDGDGHVDHADDPDCLASADNTEHPTGAVGPGDLLVVTDAGLLRFNYATHDYGVVLGGGRYIGDVVTSTSGEIFVSDLAAGQIVSIDPATGQETPVADVSFIPFRGPSSMAMASDGSLWVTNLVELLRVEPATGNVTQIPAPVIPVYVSVAETRGAIYVIYTESSVGSVDVLRVDPDTGETELFAAGLGAPDAIHPYGEALSLISHGRDLLVAVGNEVLRLTPPDPTPVSVATTSWDKVFLDIAMADDGALHFIEGSCYCGYGPCRCSGLGSYRLEVFDPAACSDRIDNDGDGLTDYPNDPGCFDSIGDIEDPECQDGFNNDPSEDTLIDFDGGASAGVPPEQQTDPDPECSYAWQMREASCGLGAELTLLLPLLIWLRRSSRGSKSATASP